MLLFLLLSLVFAQDDQKDRVQVRNRIEPAGPTTDEYDEALRNITYLSPMEFEEVPLHIRKLLTAIECMIPQTPIPERHNIISGEFAKPGQTDWAAMCSVRGWSRVFVAWGGPMQCPPLKASFDKYAMLVAEPDEDGERYIFFARSIFATTAGPRDDGPKEDESRIIWQREPPPENRTHDSIGITFFGHGAPAYYCHEGRWLQYQTGGASSISR